METSVCCPIPAELLSLCFVSSSVFCIFEVCVYMNFILFIIRRKKRNDISGSVCALPSATEVLTPGSNGQRVKLAVSRASFPSVSVECCSAVSLPSATFYFSNLPFVPWTCGFSPPAFCLGFWHCKYIWEQWTKVIWRWPLSALFCPLLNSIPVTPNSAARLSARASS